jgi:hypothetical protein
MIKGPTILTIIRSMKGALAAASVPLVAPGLMVMKKKSGCLRAIADI